MVLTDRDASVLETLLFYGYLVTNQLRALFFQADKDGSVARDRLRKMDAAGLITRRRAEVANPFSSNTMPTWIITERGISALALYRDDTRFLSQKPPCTRSWQLFCHYVCVSDLAIKLRQSAAAQDRVQLGDMFFEHTVVNAEADDPAKRYRLYTVVCEQPKRVICAPDQAFEIRLGEHRMAYYVELERGSDSPVRVGFKKTPGYAAFAQARRWKTHFPQAQKMKVLAVAPSANWRESLRKAIRDKPGAEMWMFAALGDVTPESFLCGPIWHTCEGEVRPLVRPVGVPAAGVPDVGGQRE